MTIAEAPHALLNRLPPAEARQALGRCCGANAWIEGMVARLPFVSDGALYAAAASVWGTLGRADYLEAFAHHPQIGGRAGDTSGWAAAEQARVGEATPDVVTALAAANCAYLARFGYIFIVCATGKTAEEMLALLRARIDDEPGAELVIAAAEQAKITRLRLEKLTR